MEGNMKTAAQLAGLVMVTGVLSAAFAATAAVGVMTTQAEASTQPGALIEAPVTVLYWVDPGTGCHYLLTAAGILQPRNHSDGIQVCDYSEDGWPLDQNLSDGLSYSEDEILLPPAEPYPPTPKTMTAASINQPIKVVL
jgi:hypothetical protein